MRLAAIAIRRCTVQEILDCPDLLGEYADESAIDGMPRPCPDAPMYQALEANGKIVALGAFDEDRLVGFLVMLTVTLPHYSEKVATAESFFVSAAYRRAGVGDRLLDEAKRFAKEMGAVGLLISAPINGKLAAVLERKKSFTETNRVFFTRFV